MDPAPVVQSLSDIDPVYPLEVQLTEAARIIFERFHGVIALITALRTSLSADATPPAGPPPFVAEANAAINGALTELFERHRDRLRIEPARATAAFRGLILASGHPMMGHGEKLTAQEIVDVLLLGIADPISEVLV
jgi:hypothetical protein